MYNPLPGRWLEDGELEASNPFFPDRMAEYYSDATPAGDDMYTEEVQAASTYFPRRFVNGAWESGAPNAHDGDSNLYRYVRNQPTVATDPSGMSELLPEPIAVQVVKDPKETAKEWFKQLSEGKDGHVPNAGVYKGLELKLKDGTDHNTYNYNCYAWALNRVDLKWVGDPVINAENAAFDDAVSPGDKGGVVTEKRLKIIDEFFFKYGNGFKRYQVYPAKIDPNAAEVKGKDLIVLYGNVAGGKITSITHAVRKYKNEKLWSSKNGIKSLIEFQELKQLSGGTYGSPVTLYAR